MPEVAQLMPELAEGLGPMGKRRPIHEQYEHVLRMDQKMREVVHQIPAFMLREDAAEYSEIPWLGIARRSLAITAADKVSLYSRFERGEKKKEVSMTCN